MKLALTTCLYCLSFFIGMLSYGQEINSSQSGETILKIENPYNKGKTKWLNKNGFDTKTYAWNDPKINLYVDKALNRRGLGNTLAYTGTGIVVLGIVANILGTIGHAVSDSSNEPYQVIKGPYYLGGALIVSSVGFTIDSFSKLKKAKKARNKKFN